MLSVGIRELDIHNVGMPAITDDTLLVGLTEATIRSHLERIEADCIMESRLDIENHVNFEVFEEAFKSAPSLGATKEEWDEYVAYPTLKNFRRIRKLYWIGF